MRNFFVLSGLWAQFFKILLKYFTNGCQNYNLRVQRSTLRNLIFFWEFCKCVLRLWAIVVDTSGDKFQQRCPNCILRVKKNISVFFAVLCHVVFNVGFERKKILVLTKKVSSVLSILHSKRRRTFWGKFFQKHFFFNWVWILRQKILNYQRKVSSREVKTVFYVSSGPLWEWLSHFLKFSKVFGLWAIIVRTSG